MAAGLITWLDHPDSARFAFPARYTDHPRRRTLQALRPHRTPRRRRSRSSGRRLPDRRPRRSGHRSLPRALVPNPNTHTLRALLPNLRVRDGYLQLMISLSSRKRKTAWQRCQNRDGKGRDDQTYESSRQAPWDDARMVPGSTTRPKFVNQGESRTGLVRSKTRSKRPRRFPATGHSPRPDRLSRARCSHVLSNAPRFPGTRHSTAVITHIANSTLLQRIASARTAPRNDGFSYFLRKKCRGLGAVLSVRFERPELLVMSWFMVERDGMLTLLRAGGSRCGRGFCRSRCGAARGSRGAGSFVVGSWVVGADVELWRREAAERRAGWW